MSIRPFALCVLLAAAACTGGSKSAGPTTSTLAPGATTSTTLNPSLATAPLISSTTVAETGDVPTGKSFGFITSFDTATTASFDLATYLTGKEADKAATDDGVITAGQHVENDYYIQNKNPKLRTIRFTPEVIVQTVDCGSGPCKLVRTNIDTLKKKPTPIPVWINVFKTVVLTIDEQYRP
jgi:hypothetical protein